MQTFIRQDSPPVWVRLEVPENGGPVAADCTVARALGPHAGAPSVGGGQVGVTHAALSSMLPDADHALRAGVGRCGP
jgi:hypothetical protein